MKKVKSRRGKRKIINRKRKMKEGGMEEDIKRVQKVDNSLGREGSSIRELDILEN